MLQLMFGLPLWQWPVPSWASFTVVNPAPVTGEAADTVAVPASAATTSIPNADAPAANHRRDFFSIDSTLPE